MIPDFSGKFPIGDFTFINEVLCQLSYAGVDAPRTLTRRGLQIRCLLALTGKRRSG
jgi:hypothetical protein